MIAYLKSTNGFHSANIFDAAGIYRGYVTSTRKPEILAHLKERGCKVVAVS